VVKIQHFSTQVGEVTNEQQVQNFLARAQQQRAVASTNCNEHSLRSHSVLRMKLTGRNVNNTETSNDKLFYIPFRNMQY
jgi:kinesin family protein C1